MLGEIVLRNILEFSTLPGKSRSPLWFLDSLLKIRVDSKGKSRTILLELKKNPEHLAINLGHYPEEKSGEEKNKEAILIGDDSACL